MSLLELISPAALLPAIDDIIAAMLQGKISKAEGEALVKERDAAARLADAKAAAEADAMGKAFRRAKHVGEKTSSLV